MPERTSQRAERRSVDGASKPVKLTEADLLGMLAARHNEKAGNGEAWAFIPKVRNAAGFDANRTIDAMAMALWPSRGLVLDAFEIKCSRSDWQRELKEPAKAEAFATTCDRFWLVVADRKIVQPGELPPGWGLLYVHGKSLRCDQEATFLHDEGTVGPRTIRPLPPGFTRSFLAALLRSACRQASIEEPEIVAAREQGRREGEEHAEAISASYKGLHNDLADAVREFEQASGIPVRGYNWRDQDPKTVGEAVKVVLNGSDELARLQSRMERIVTEAESIADFARERVAQAQCGPQGVLDVA